MTVAAQRTGPLSRLVFYPETTFDSDSGITAGYVVPLAGASAAADTQARVPAPFYDGTLQPVSSFAGPIMFGGQDPINMEFAFVGSLLKTLFGASGYSHVASTKLHQYVAGFAPGSCQLQREWTEPTAQYLRARGVRPSKWNPKYAANQPVTYSVDWMGLGDIVASTDLAGTKTVVCPNPVSPFSGYLMLDGVKLGTVTAFDLMYDWQDQRQEAAFNQGIAAAVNTGKLKIDVTLTIIFDSTANLATYTNAVNDHQFTLECEYADLPGDLATQWLRFVFPKVKLPRPALNVGGNNGLVQQFKGSIEYDCNSGRAGELYSGNGIVTATKAPWTITLSTNDVISVKIDGAGSPTSVTIPAGTYATADALVAAIPSIAGATVLNFNGYIMIRSATTGATSSVQATAAANNANTTLGFDTVAHSGSGPNAMYIDLQNALTAAY